MLRRPDFRRLYGTRLTSQFADGVFQASLAGVVLFSPESAGDPAEIAGAFAVLLLPYSLIGPFAGVLLDRWRRQRVLLVAERAALPAGRRRRDRDRDAGSRASPFYATALLVISVNRFFLAALSAALPHVVEPDAAGHRRTRCRTTSGAGRDRGSAAGSRCCCGRSSAPATRGVRADRRWASVLGYGSSALLAAAGFGPDHARPGRRAALAPGDPASTSPAGWSPGPRHVAERRAGRRGAGGDRRAPVLLRHLDHLDPAALPQLLHRRRRLPGRARRARRRSSPPARPARCSPRPITPAAIRRIGKHAWVTVLLRAGRGDRDRCSACRTDAGRSCSPRFCSGSSPRARRSASTRLVQEQVDGRLPRPGVLLLRHAVQRHVRRAAAVVAALLLPDDGHVADDVIVVIAAGYAAHRARLRPDPAAAAPGRPRPVRRVT